MDIREIDLPGVGKKFAITTNSGERITIIIHNTGHREIYNFKRGEDFPFYALRLDDDEARKLSAVLGGAYFQPAVSGSVDMILEQLSIEWVKVESTSPLAGRTIGALQIRQRTGGYTLALVAIEEARQEIHRVHARRRRLKWSLFGSSSRVGCSLARWL